VFEYVDTNDRLEERRPLKAAVTAVWSRETTKRLAEVIADCRPEIAHFHNTFAMMSPAGYYACRRAGVAVVQTLHNYRMGCVNACCLSGGKTCESCIGQPVAWRGIWRGCYRGSRTASAAVAAISAVHRGLGTYRNVVDAFISPSEFARSLHLRCGVPEEISYCKPNFAEGPPAEVEERGNFALFVGRLSEEKGVDVLLEAWSLLGDRLALRIVGDGPDGEGLRRRFGHLPGVTFVGAATREAVQREMSRASFLIQPSLVYENCSVVVIEALAAGLPCIVSGHGSLPELVDASCGMQFPPGDAFGLAACAARMTSNDEGLKRMREGARRRFAERYSAEANYAQLVRIYAAAWEHSRRRSRTTVN
jgi:glycosyltransferase involved in cell wall biosynthesis